MSVHLLQPTRTEWPALLRQRAYRGMPAEPGALPSRVLVDQFLLGLHPTRLGYRYGMPFLIVDDTTNRIVGNIGGKGWLPDEEEVEIGYEVADAYRGRGLMTAALRALQRMAREDRVSLLAHVERDNQSSRRVLEKCGFAMEALVSLPDSLLLERWAWSPDED